ncbi:MAG TPA: YihY/virulence factor BrkB family protein [Verrucomicrobiae bacterium]|nr:YihY/virulence factor BrkB family protein [Verrucomicrobiae bacterium]
MAEEASVQVQNHSRSRRSSRAAIARSTWHGFMADDCMDLAAQMSFYFALSIFPFLLVVASIVGWLPFTNVWQTFAEWIITYLPTDSRHLLFSTIVDLTHGYKSFFSLGVLGMVWSASSGFVSLMESLSKTHGVPETRSFARKHVIAVIATFGAAFFFIASFAVITLGHWLRSAIAGTLTSQGVTHFPWEAVRFAATLVIMCIGVDLVDHFLPDMKRPWRWFPVSSIIVSLTFVGATEAVNFYMRHTSSFSKVYGAIAGFIIFLTWVYIASLVLLIAAEAEKAARNAEGRGASA